MIWAVAVPYGCTSLENRGAGAPLPVTLPARRWWRSRPKSLDAPEGPDAEAQADNSHEPPAKCPDKAAPQSGDKGDTSISVAASLDLMERKEQVVGGLLPEIVPELHADRLQFLLHFQDLLFQFQRLLDREGFRLT